MYRHIALLAKGELLEVEREELVNGIVERHFRLVRVRAVIDPAAAAAMTNDDHRRGFAAVTASLLAEFNAYLDRPGSKPTSDSISYRQFPLWLTAAERTDLVEEIAAAIQARLVHDPSADRKRHLLTTILFPAELHGRKSDLPVLRELVDEGNEEAARRLTEIAFQRGDLDELRRLVDAGSEEAAIALTELVAQRGDLDELRRLADEGHEGAEARLAERIREMR